MSYNKKDNLIQSIIKGPSLGYTNNYPNRNMWKELAIELNGNFKIKHNSGYELETHCLIVPYSKWNIEISVSDTRPLKFKISFQPNQEFELIVSLEDFIERLLKKFSKPEVEIGNKEFDNKYLIKSNRPNLVKVILTPEIQESLLKFNVYSISYQTNNKKKNSQLISVIQRLAGEKEMIIELVKTFKQLIDNLEKQKIIK